MKEYEFFKTVKETMPENYIDHHEGNIPGAGDLYVKKTTESEKLVQQYDFPSCISIFESQTKPVGIWYEIYGGWCEEYEARYQKLQIETLRAENEMLKEKNEHLLDHLDRLQHETITAEGTVCTEAVFGRNHSLWEINTSSILTKLIQEAGRWCENFASDLFIRWREIQKGLETATVEPGRYVFAFRENGVDGSADYMNYSDACGSYDSYSYYRAVWILDISISEDTITMQLRKQI